MQEHWFLFIVFEGFTQIYRKKVKTLILLSNLMKCI